RQSRAVRAFRLASLRGSGQCVPFRGRAALRRGLIVVVVLSVRDLRAQSEATGLALREPVTSAAEPATRIREDWDARTPPWERSRVGLPRARAEAILPRRLRQYCAGRARAVRPATAHERCPQRTAWLFPSLA